MNEEQEEIQRIREIYENKQFSYLNPLNYYLLISKEKTLHSFLTKNYRKTLSTVKIMVVEFGDGSEIYSLMKYGVKPRNIYGTEIIKDYYENLKFSIPDANLRMIDNFIMPYPNGLFDIVIQTNFLSVIKKENARSKMSSEMFRLIKKGGMIFSYDLKKSTSTNIGIDKEELKKLFPDASKITSLPVTTSSSVASSFVNYPLVCETLEKIPFLTSHYYTTIEKN